MHARKQAMAGIARKLITRSKLFSTRSCFNLHHQQQQHHRLLSTMNIISSSPASSSGSIAAAGGTATKTRPKQRPFFSPCTVEGLALEYGRDHQLWKVAFSSRPEKRLRLQLPRDEIIAEYVKFLATALKCDEEEAKKRICSVLTRHHLFFTCQVPVETAAHFLELDRTCAVDPVYDEDFQREDYAETAEPFIDGKAVEYDPIYHKAILNKFYVDRPGINIGAEETWGLGNWTS